MLIPFISLQFSWNTAVIQKNTIKYILFKILPSKSSGGRWGWSWRNTAPGFRPQMEWTSRSSKRVLLIFMESRKLLPFIFVPSKISLYTTASRTVRLMKYMMLKLSSYIIFPKHCFINVNSFNLNKEEAINHSLLYWRLFTFSDSLNHKLYNAIYIFSASYLPNQILTFPLAHPYISFLQFHALLPTSILSQNIGLDLNSFISLWIAVFIWLFISHKSCLFWMQALSCEKQEKLLIRL